jgi:hypothetical protein
LASAALFPSESPCNRFLQASTSPNLDAFIRAVLESLLTNRAQKCERSLGLTTSLKSVHVWNTRAFMENHDIRASDSLGRSRTLHWTGFFIR